VEVGDVCDRLPHLVTVLFLQGMSCAGNNVLFDVAQTGSAEAVEKLCRVCAGLVSTEVQQRGVHSVLVIGFPVG